MSKESRDLIGKFLTRKIQGCDNKTEFEKVVKALALDK